MLANALEILKKETQGQGSFLIVEDSCDRDQLSEVATPFDVAVLAWWASREKRMTTRVA